MTLDTQMEAMIREFSAEPAPEEGPSWSRVAVRYLLAALDEARATIERRDGVIRILERDVAEARSIAELQQERVNVAQADNAALLSDLNRLIGLIKDGEPAHEYHDGEEGNYTGNIVHPDWIVGEQVRAELPHPGLSLLDELEALRKALELAEEYVPQYDGCVAWEALNALDAIRNREGRHE